MAQGNGILPPLKRSSASQSPIHEPATKRQKRHYHHNHKLHHPVQTQLREPALLDDGAVAHLLECSIGQILTETGYDIAEPTAIDAFRHATEEYILHLASFARQSMTASRRIQPIPQDFEFALQRAFIGTDELTPYVKSLKSEKTIPTLLPSPPPEEDDLFGAFTGIPVLSEELSGEDERNRINYIPAHFPQFPSKHTYRFTPVFTERETDPRRIRELGMEDSRHGEEALRKLARAAFKDTHATGTGKSERRLWGRKTESAETMFEKTIRGLSKKVQQPVDSQGGGAGQKDSKSSLANLDLAPIVNCERSFWRKSTSGTQKAEKLPDKDSVIAKVERWVST
ncbi:bromodomain associated domain protein [Talaromyces stipitatus ATCC 10500]|uniref:Transcription initiation factor TFIID subunit 8 n=1 Tax=Talaromyces stipitatus (strain ATCC 10500 / CBS 375.48 / QM 6759 / NRRL 1006) TaxID=441959 RepID=B8MTF1_TALSN|nr:bromodomain associated domain protein [Talaromyces stipitatus ATCC 10500]EED12196.1 bromodomain associated domain protein [Talaromyces stipitatus ATCC 10500]